VCCGSTGPAALTLESSIIRGVGHSFQRFATSSSADLTLRYSDYNSATGSNNVAHPGTLTQTPGNINLDPLFAGVDDFHLLAGSPAIDAGTAPLNGSTADRDGYPRTQDGNGDGTAVTDMGAYEFPASIPPPGPGPAPGPALTVTPPPPPVAVADRVHPVASGLLASPFAFAAAAQGASMAVRRIGTTVTYRLSEAATTRFTVQRRRPGRLVARVCRVPTRANRLRPACWRYVALTGGFSHAGRQNANSLRFTGRLLGRKLPPGFYRLVAVPTDAAGNRGAARTLPFRIVP
jgi:hypothetical protein